MKKIIISGACGFIGSSLISRIINEDVHLWALDRDFCEDAIINSEKITYIRDDELNELACKFKFDEFDVFYNFAWQGVNGADKTKYDVQIDNIKLTLKYAQLAQKIGCHKYLCAGTIAERAIDSLEILQTTSAGMMYSAAKVCAHTLLETFCKNIGINFVWMQFSNIYGPKNKTGNLISYTLDQLKKGEQAYFGPAQQIYDFLYTDELIEAIFRLGMMKESKNYYYIGSGKPRKLEDYLRTVGNIYGRPDLIRIGERPDDGVVYSADMMDSSETIATLGNYITDSFENHIKYTIEKY